MISNCSVWGCECVCVVRRHPSCCAVRLGNTKHFMDKCILEAAAFHQLCSHRPWCVSRIRKSTLMVQRVATIHANENIYTCGCVGLNLFAFTECLHVLLGWLQILHILDTRHTLHMALHVSTYIRFHMEHIQQDLWPLTHSVVSFLFLTAAPGCTFPLCAFSPQGVSFVCACVWCTCVCVGLCMYISGP